MRTRSAESIAQAKATREANKGKKGKQEIKLKGLTLKKLDPLNWTIERPKQRPLYYGTLLAALEDIPNKMLDEAQIKDIRDIKQVLVEIKEEISSIRLMKLGDWS